MSKFKDALERISKIAETLPDDDPDKVEMMNIEGDYTNLMEWALIKRNDALMMVDGCASMAKLYSLRKQSFQNKADNMKDILGVILDCANEVKYKGVSGTVTRGNVKPKPIVNDESKLPKRYIKITSSIDKALINKDIKEGINIDGVVMDNGGVTTIVRM